MNCDQIKDQLEAYVLDTLDPDERILVEQHLPVCPDCQRRADELVEIVNRLPEALAAASSLRPPDSLKSRLLQSLEAEAVSSAPPGKSPAGETYQSVSPTRSPSPVPDGKRTLASSDRGRSSWSRRLWQQRRSVAVLAALLLLLLIAAWGARFGIALAQERAQLRTELARLIDRQEVVLEVIDADQAIRRVLLPPERERDTAAPPYGKIFTRPDLPHVVAMIARLPQPPAGQAYHLWLTRQDQTQLVGVMAVNEDGFSLLVFDEDIEGPTYDSAQLTLQPEGSTSPAGDPILIWEAPQP